MRPRFSLRWLLVLIALASAAFGWIARPVYVAHRFASVLAAKDYAAATAMCVTCTHLNELHGQVLASDGFFKIVVRRSTRTLPDMLLGRAPIMVAAQPKGSQGCTSGAIIGNATVTGIFLTDRR
jgi:hypothetical protein